MASSPVILFHEALQRTVRARGLVGDRAQKARTAVNCYMRALKRAAVLTGDRSLERILIDCELTELENKLNGWRLLGSETALVCDATLAVVRRERIENLCDRRLSEIMPQIDAPKTNRSASS